ncbi:hypothetical protein [Mesorhizobium sp. SARCC-RB16n]|uniref:hypothetical protein n=1 Tax=Mesorhizobium sp. SARCC-RB16n TaxID=2116687 RepID=UPI0016644381|nr:hypothetical protein [Mesorhizobium sp. SARCC-RB16n]
MAATVAPVAAANPAPDAAATVATTPVAIVATMMPAMPVAMGDLLQLCSVIPFEEGRIRLVKLIENSVALGNTGNRAAGSGHARKHHRPRKAKHSSKKQPTFHKTLRVVDHRHLVPSPETGSSAHADRFERAAAGSRSITPLRAG